MFKLYLSSTKKATHLKPGGQECFPRAVDYCELKCSLNPSTWPVWVQ